MRSILTCLFSFMVLIQAYAQSGQINGVVRDDDGKPLPGATINIQHTHIKVVSDQNGSFQIQKLPLGKHTITASLTGHRTTTQQIELKNESLFVTFALGQSIEKIQTVHIHDHTKTNKQEESLNIEILNQQFIQRYLGGSLTHTLERLPGVNMIGVGSGQSKPLIRGLGFNRVVVVDKGIKHEGQQWGVDHGLELDQFAASEIEIVKGAASFIYGSDAIAGAIRVNPAVIPESNEIHGSVNLIGKTNNGLYGTSLSLGGRTNKVVYGGRLTYQNYGDYRVPTDVVHVYDYPVELHRHHVRNTAGRELNYHLHTGYVGEHFRSLVYVSNAFTKAGFFANAHGLEPRRVNTDEHDASSRDLLLPYQQVRHFKVINQNEYKTEDNILSLELGVQHNYREEFSRYSGHGYMPPNYPEDLPIPQHLEREYDKKTYSANLRNEREFGRHCLTVGVNGDYQDNNIGGWGFLIPAFRQGNIGAFIYERYRLSESTLLHGAVRYNHINLRTSQYTDWFTSEIEDNGSSTEQHLVRAENLNKSYNSLVWSLGANYNKGHFNAKANIGKSFRVPTAQEFAANGVNYHYFRYEVGDSGISPEESYQVDLGLEWNDEEWQVAISPFYNYFPNYIYLNPTPRFDHEHGAGNQVFEYKQSTVRRYGGEFQAKYAFLKDLLSAEVLGEYIYALQLSGEKKGYTLPFSPPPSVLANLTWTPHISKRIENFYFSADVRFRGKQENIVPPEKVTPSYRTVNIQTGFHTRVGKQPIQLNMQIVNLFNSRFMDHTSFYRLIELPEAGRNVVVSLRAPIQIKG